jgi:hypothetical protein
VDVDVECNTDSVKAQLWCLGAPFIPFTTTTTTTTAIHEEKISTMRKRSYTTSAQESSYTSVT